METTRERTEQLHEGIAGAAAALPETDAAWGRKAVEAADRVLQADEGDVGSRDAAIERMERAHYALLRVAVLGEAPGEAGLEEAVAELERMADGPGAAAAAG